MPVGAPARAVCGDAVSVVRVWAAAGSDATLARAKE